VLKWVHARVTGAAAGGAATEACLGWLPAAGADGLDLNGLSDAQQAAARNLLRVDKGEWREELLRGEQFLKGTFKERLPPELLAAGAGLLARTK
jgi:GTP-dependent phosphoenolpyruvate carboxykinase